MTQQTSKILTGLLMMVLSLLFIAQFATMFATLALSDVTLAHCAITFVFPACFSSGVVLFGNSDKGNK